MFTANDERLQRAPDNRPGWFRRGIRLPEGRHGKDVRDEVPRQEAHQDEAGRDSGVEREDNALASQYGGELLLSSYHHL